MPILPIDWLKTSEKAVIPCKHGLNASKLHNPTSVLCSFGVEMHNPTSVQCSFGVWSSCTSRHLTGETRLYRFCVMQDACTLARCANACCNMARTMKTSTTSHGDCARSMGLRKLSTLYPTPTRWSRAVSTRCRSKRG